MKTLTFALLAALAFGSIHSATAADRAKPGQPTPPGLTYQKKAAKPDFVILHAGSVGGTSNELMVQIKNAGTVNSPGALLQANNMAPGNSGAATTPFIHIKAGQFIWVKVVLNKPARKGDRIILFADHNNAVAETKENNNKYAFNF
ncbi:hypothetical protein HBA54_20595 [Pelagibius litoralis]|uniref:CARDB domain-containing protein n=1 Tax=Pelagibius litoralis TaxID=374515 RepID=A0A967F0Y2_9PROT|nr:CARDB domain-containing protein [Pelagibius litoralis]NIA71003.1 hypothetical protein [Pelagibius litoralis]